MQTERQQEIITTSLELISEKGIQGLTIKNLSKRIGISEPAIYRHYENKIAILVAVLDDFKSRSYHLFMDASQGAKCSVEKIALLFNNHFNAFTAMPALSSVIFSEEIFRNEDALKEKISEVIEQNNGILVAIIIEGQREKDIRSDVDAQQLTIMVMGSLRLFIKKWQLSDFRFNLKEEGEKIIHMIRLLIKK